MTNVDRLTTVKLRDSNSAGGMSGRRRVSIRTGVASVATAPTARAPHASVSFHSICWPRVAPNASPPTPMAMTMAPSQSKSACASSSRLSGTPRVAHRASSTSGTLMRKADRQLALCTSTPPSRGPMIDVADVPAAHRPMARPRSSPEKVAVRIERLPGTRTAPKPACTTRAAIRISIVGASPHATDAAPNPTSPTRNIRRRP